jgi:hypothetical protein
MAARDFCIPNPRYGYWEHQPARETIGQWHADDATERLLQYLSETVVTDNTESTPERFRRLAAEWEAEVRNVSSLTAMASHPKYRQIVGLGWEVVPLMLGDLQANRGFWFPALNEITGIQPFDPRDAGNSKRMIRAWIEWGKRKKLI